MCQFKQNVHQMNETYIEQIRKDYYYYMLFSHRVTRDHGVGTVM